MERIGLAASKMAKGNVETWLVKELSEIASHHNLSIIPHHRSQQRLQESIGYRFQPQQSLHRLDIVPTL